MFYGQISVRNTEKQHLPDFFISGFPRDFIIIKIFIISWTFLS